MNERIIVTATLVVLIFFTGLWLSRRGRPYTSLLLTLHKLAGLAACALLLLTLVQVARATPLGLREIALVASTALLLVAAVAAGGALSTGKAVPAFVIRVHQILPYAAAVSAAAMLYFLFNL